MVNLGRLLNGAGPAAVLVIALLMAQSVACAAEVTARVDRNEVVQGETITLILQTADPQQSLETDFRVLEPDFEFLGRQSATQMSIVNGRQVTDVRMLVTLEPRRSGELTIPALQFPGASTAPIPIRVKPAPEPQPGEQQPVFIELTLDPAQGPYYVHAQLSLTVRIFYRQNLTEAAITPPVPQQASVRLLDEIPFQADRNGERYRVLERRYAIFPERSGELEIPPLELTGRLIERPADRLWQPAVRGRRIRVSSDTLVIPVESRPAAYTGEHWLPARRITISQQLSDAQSLSVGEPVTRSVILDAVGLEENMLEEPAWPAMTGARVYPDQPQGITRDDGQWVLGHKEFRYAVVPEQPGELVLPEIRLDWWDTVDNQQRTAVLPAHRVVVTAPDIVPVTTALPAEPATGFAGSTEPGLAGGGADDVWRWLALVLGVLWLATLWLYFRQSSTLRPKAAAGPEMPADEAQLLVALEKACRRGDAAATRNLLFRWLRRHGPEQAHGSLMDFAETVDHRGLRQAIHGFDAGGFGPEPGKDWDGREFWRLFDAWRRQGPGRRAENQSVLPDLYRQAR